jgi:hypothetical protein
MQGERACVKKFSQTGKYLLLMCWPFKLFSGKNLEIPRFSNKKRHRPANQMNCSLIWQKFQKRTIIFEYISGTVSTCSLSGFLFLKCSQNSFLFWVFISQCKAKNEYVQHRKRLQTWWGNETKLIYGCDASSYHLTIVQRYPRYTLFWENFTNSLILFILINLFGWSNFQFDESCQNTWRDVLENSKISNIL